MADRNVALQLLITAKDEASAIVGRIFGFLDKTTSATANLVREKFTNLFGGGLEGAAEFEAQLDRVQAKGGYAKEEMAGLKTAAQEMGVQFGLSGTDAAKGMESLAAAGLSATDAIKALPAVLAIAKAEQISTDDAAQKLIDSLSVMGLGFEQAGRMADVLAKGANITTSSAAQLAEALSEAGGTARAAGLDLEVTVAALDLLHKNGIKGSEAGTALKSILVSLLDPSSKASQELDKLGISSRDLGTVLEALKGKGSLANAAILAFGTEAGPGLRALLAEGREGLDSYTSQLRNADGAAAQAADQMGGNLKAAMEALSSAWGSLKAALIDPALEPITIQVRALAAAFQEGLSSDKFKEVQDTIKAFAESTSQSVGAFIRSFDFVGALQATADFAQKEKESFSVIVDAGSVSANAIQIAWNGLTAGVKTIAGAILGVLSSVMGNLAAMEGAAAKVGLGTVERANELNEKALAMKAAAAELFKQVATDGRELGAAFERMTDQTGKAATAQRALKEALPVAEIQAIKRSLSDYAGLLDRAKDAQKQAAQAASDAEADWLELGQAMDKGTGSAAAYAAAAQKNKAAQEALKVANQNVAQSSSDYSAEVQRAIRETTAESAVVAESVQVKKKAEDVAQDNIKAAKRYVDSLEDAVSAQVNGLKAEVALAEAKGDTVTAQRKARDMALLEAEGSARVARAKQAEQEMEYALAVIKRDQVAALVEKNQASIEDLALSELQIQKELAEAQAAKVNAEAQEILAEKLRLVNAAKAGAISIHQESTGATEKNTAALKENAEANKETGKAAKEGAENAKAAGDIVSSFYNAAITVLSSLSKGAVSAFKTMRGEIVPTGDALDVLKNRIDSTEAGLNRMGTGNGHFVAFLAKITRDALDVQKAFLGQAEAAERLSENLEKVGNGGLYTGEALEALIRDAQRATTQFTLLDDARLDRLKDAIDEANEKIQQMQEETESARQRLADLNAEILDEQGQDQQANLLRQQIEYQQQLADIERQRKEAELQGNRELLELLDEQKRKLDTLNRLKIDNIQKEKPDASAVDRTADSYRTLGDELERVNRLTGTLARSDLSEIVGQANALRSTLADVSALL